MNKYFVAGYYVEREDRGYKIEIFNEFDEPIDERRLEYEVSRQIAELPDGTYKECFSINVNIVYDEHELPLDLIPKRIYFGRLEKNLLAVYYLKLKTINNMRDMFAGCTSFVGFKWWEAAGEPFSETDNVTDTSHMFYECRALVSLDLSKLNTEHVKYMEGMFEYCESLQNLDISGYYMEGFEKVFYWNTSNVCSMAFMFRDCKSLTTLSKYSDTPRFDTTNLETTESMFEGCELLKTLGMGSGFGLNLHNVKNADRMFKGCRQLAMDSIELESLYHVETMESMYEDCVSMEYLEISSIVDGEWNTERFKNLRNIKNLCKNCSQLKKILFYNLNLVNMNIDDIEGIIDNCPNLEAVYFNGLDYGVESDKLIRLIEYLRDNSSSKIRLIMPDMKGEGLSSGKGLFKGFTNLSVINIDNFDMTNMDDLSEMFMDCSNLGAVSMEGCDASNIRYTDSMFENCSSLWNIDIGHLTLQRIVSTNKMFKNCGFIKEIRFNNECVFEFLASANEMFYGCEDMNLLEIPNFDVRRIGASFAQLYLETDMRDMFWNCRGLTTLKLNNFKIDNSTSLDTDITVTTQLGDYRFDYFFRYLGISASNLRYIEMRDFNNPRLTSMKGMFKDFKNVETIDLTGCSTENITDMSDMFNNCLKLNNLDLSSFNTEKVTTMEGMFSNTESLTQCNIMFFNYKNVTTLKNLFHKSGIEQIPPSNYGSSHNVVDVSYMFASCWNLTDASNIRDLRTYCVENMTGMFWGCGKLESIELHNFNTSKVKYMGYMFRNCEALVELDLSSFDTNNVISFESMFESCTSIQKLDLSNFRAGHHQKRSYRRMFRFCKNLEMVDISVFTGRMEDSNGAEGMFEGCEKLSYIDMSNFRHNDDKFNNSMGVFKNVGINTNDNVLNVGLLYIDRPEICMDYAKKLNNEVYPDVKRINIYVQDVNVDELMMMFDHDIDINIDSRVRFIKYANEVKRIDLPITIPAKNKLCWNANLREYYIENYIGDEFMRVHEKIKIPTFSTTMHLDFNPWCERDDDGNIMWEPDVKYVKVQIPMKEKIEEESDK